jgi:phage major head subunit gpT-like protein
MISNNVPNHLIVTARTGFLTTAEPKTPVYSDIAATFTMDAKSQELVDIGGSPMPLEWVGRPEQQDFIEKKLQLNTKEWVIKVGISYRAVRDDQTGSLKRKCESAGDNFQRHIAQQVYATLNAGDATLGYDGLNFFADAHVDKGAVYTTGQDNLNNLALDIDNFETVLTASRRFKDDQGNFADYDYDLLITSPENEREAASITGKGLFVPTTLATVNPYAGKFDYRTSNQFDSTAWVLVASKAPIKPVIVAMRERPGLRAATFDADGPDGGMYYFWFGASYNHFLGDWRLANMGKS